MDEHDKLPQSETRNSENLTQLRLVLSRYLRILADTTPMPGSVTFTRSMLESYVIALRDLNPEQMEYALNRCLKECDFFPSAPEIRRYCEDWTPEEERRETADRVRRTIEASRLGALPPYEVRSLPEDPEERRKLLEGYVDDVAVEKDMAAQRATEPIHRLSPQEFEARMRQLERQKEKLLREQKPEGSAS